MSDDQFTQFPDDTDPLGPTDGHASVTQYDVDDDGNADISVTVSGDVTVVETNMDGTTEAVVYDHDVPVAYARDVDADGQLGPDEIVEIVPIDGPDTTSPDPSTPDPGGADPTDPNAQTPVDIVVEMPDGDIAIGPPTIDTDNDNIPDAARPDEHTLVIDADHDGRADRVIITDEAGEVTTDAVRDPATGEWTRADTTTPGETTTPTDGGDAPVTPADTQPEDGTTGTDTHQRSEEEIAEDETHWFEQNTPYTCAPSAMTEVLSDFFDLHDGAETDVANWARAQGLLEEGSGMDLPGMVEVFNHYEVPAHIETGTWESVDAYLSDGKAVILAVDPSKYWGDGNTPGGHAVRIIDVDLDRGVAILSDSGTPDGKGLEVPLSELEAGWNIQGHQMIVTDVRDTDAAGNDTFMEPATVDARPSEPQDAETQPTEVDTQPSGATPTGDAHSTEPAAGEEPEVSRAGIVLLPIAMTAAGWAALRRARQRRG
jgi:hypothetical protein